MSETPQPAPDDMVRAEPEDEKPREKRKHAAVHEVNFITYPKLLFIWPIILLGLVFWPLGYPAAPAAVDEAPAAVDMPVEGQAPDATAGPADPNAAASPEKTEGAAAEAEQAAARPDRPTSPRLEVLGWLYILMAVLVFLTLGVDVDRNQAIFWVVLFLGVYVGGLYLQDVKGITVLGNIYRWFDNIDVQYDRSFGLALSILLLVPYLVMLGWARLNDRWRITHNEFEHYSLGKMDDSLGRGAKTIRTSFPDMFELLLGLAGTLIVYNATGNRELRRIPHVMFLPLVRRRLNRILETTSITAAQYEDEEEADDDDAL